MSQKMLLKTLQPQQDLLSFNMGNIDELFPGFAPGDFAVLYGSQSIEYLTSLLCVRAQLPTQVGGLNTNVLFIDSGNTFNRHQVTRLLQRHHLNLKQALNKIHISRACSAYQLTSLIMEHLRNMINEFNAKIVIISNITSLFLADTISDEEASRVFNQVTSCLQRLAHENHVIILATCSRYSNNYRNSTLIGITCKNSNVNIVLRTTLYDSEFELEKHPHHLLGIAEFPSTNPTLMDFT